MLDLCWIRQKNLIKSRFNNAIFHEKIIKFSDKKVVSSFNQSNKEPLKKIYTILHQTKKVIFPRIRKKVYKKSQIIKYIIQLNIHRVQNHMRTIK